MAPFADRDRPMATYRGQGVSKPSVKKSEHCIIFTGSHVPPLTSAETPKRDERPLKPLPVRVITTDRAEELDPMSRLNLGERRPLHYNVRVRDVGKVAEDFESNLLDQYHKVNRERRSDEKARKKRLRAARTAHAEELRSPDELPSE